MLSNSEYKINGTGKHLVFLEGGGYYWRLYGQGTGNVSPITIFNYGSMFLLSSGESEYTLKYAGLDYIEQGVLVTIVGLALMIVCLKFLGDKRSFLRGYGA